MRRCVEGLFEMSGYGYAVVRMTVCDTKVFENTVASTPRAAAVNFLVTEQNIMVHNGMSDAEIWNLWNIHCGQFQIHEVVIEVGKAVRPG